MRIPIVGWGWGAVSLVGMGKPYRFWGWSFWAEAVSFLGMEFLGRGTAIAF